MKKKMHLILLLFCIHSLFTKNINDINENRLRAANRFNVIKCAAKPKCFAEEGKNEFYIIIIFLKREKKNVSFTYNKNILFLIPGGYSA